MIKLFKRKTEKQLLEASYKRLVDQSLKLARTDRKTSSQLATEADDLLQRIMDLKG